MTREAVEAEIRASVTSAVTRNRLTAILSGCKTVEEFAKLTAAEALAKYRETDLGKKTSVDLGPVTYTVLAAVQANVKQALRDEKSAERAAQKAELWFTREDITLTAAFMDTYRISRIELAQLRTLLSTLARDDATTVPAAPEKKEPAS